LPADFCFGGAGLQVTLDAEGDLTNGGGIAREERWSELLAAAQRGDADAYGLFLTSVTPFFQASAQAEPFG
jgi:hypothetical protein